MVEYWKLPATLSHRLVLHLSGWLSWPEVQSTAFGLPNANSKPDPHPSSDTDAGADAVAGNDHSLLA